MLGEATRLAHQIGSQLVKDLPDTPNLSDLRPSVEALHSAATHIKPPMRRAGLEEPGILDRPNPLENDDAVALITDLTRNIVPRLTQPDQYRRLVVYIRESVVATHLEGCKEEPWPFVGVGSYPGCLDQMRETLLDIAAVLEVLERSESEPAAIRGSALAGNQDETLRRAAEWCRRQHTKEGKRRRSEIQTACQATGLDVTVLESWHEDGPLRKFAITVELASLLEWSEAMATLAQVLDADRPFDETYLLVPTRLRRAVPEFAMQMITECWPSPDVEPWAAELGESHSTHLLDAFTSAHLALQTVSGVQHLPDEQRGHELVSATSDAAADRFDSARSEIDECAPGPVRDALLEVLDDLAHQVEAEQGDTGSGQSLAERLTDGLATGDTSQELQALHVARSLAQEWDIDPQAADKLLLELLDREAGQT